MPPPIAKTSRRSSRFGVLVATLGIYFCGASSMNAQIGTSTVTAALGPAAPYFTDDVTATVTVTTAAAPVPSGSIAWNTDSGGQQSAPLVNGVARIELAFFAPGAHTFHYSYSGDSTYMPVASQSLGFTVADRPFSIIGSEYRYFSNAISNGTTFTAALDSKNNIYLPAPATNSLAKLDPQGNISTVPTSGLSRPNGIVIDNSDNIYIADSGNARVVEISASGTQSVVPITGLIDPLSLAFDPSKQNLYVTDQGNGSITVYNLAAQTQTNFATGQVLYGIAVDANGNVYYSGATSAFSGDGKVYRRDSSGNTITLFTGLDNPQGLLIDQGGDLYIETGQGLFVLDPQSHLSQLTFVTSLSRPVQGNILPGNLAIDRRGNIYRPSANDIFVPGKAVNAGPAVYDPSFGHSFYVYYQVGYRETITSIAAVSGSPAVTGSNYVPTPAGSPLSAGVPFIYFDELFNVIGYAGPWSSYLTVTTSDGKQDTPIVYGNGQAASFAVAPGTITQQALNVSGIGGIVSDPNGVIYVSDTANNQVLQLPPASATTATVPFAGLNAPTQLALDGAGAVYVLDSGSSRILKIDTMGNQSVAFDLSSQSALTSLSAFTMDGGTNLYLAGSTSSGRSAIYFRDTLGNQVLVAGNLASITALAVDFNGFVYGVDSGGDLTRFDPAGNATPIEINFSRVASLAVDASDTVYAAGAAENNAGVTIVSPDQTDTVYPTDGLTADSLKNASAVAVVPDGSGSLVVGDSNGKQIFRIQRGEPFGQQTSAITDNFGDVTIGSSKSIPGFVTNVGNVATMSFGLQSSRDDFSFSTDPQECLTTNNASVFNPPLAPAASCGLSLTFSPSYLGAHSAAFNFFAPNSLGSYLSFQATGNAVAANDTPAPVLTPASIDFGNLPIGTTSAAQTATLTNTGTAPLPIYGFTVFGRNLGGFGETNNCGTSLAAGASCSIAVSCFPAIVETLTASLGVNFPSPIPQQVIALTCNGTAAAPQAALTPATANFGNVTLGTTSGPQVFTLTNGGNAALTINSISLGGANASAFTIASTTCGTSLAAAGSCTISVTFAPVATGSETAVLSVSDNAGGSPQTSSLAGTATAPPAPAATLTPSTASFTAFSGSTSAAQTFTLANPGNATLSITSVSLGGTNASAFAIASNSCGTSLAAGSSCAISVTFNPTAVGSATATLSVSDNASGSPQTSTLAGTATAPPPAADFTIAVTPASQSVTAGSSATYQINLASINGSFAQPVTFAASGIPSGATVTFTPPSVTPGSAGASSTMTVLTPVQHAAVGNEPSLWPFTAPVFAAALLFFPAKRFRRGKKGWGVFLNLVCIVSLLGLAVSTIGCGAGFALPSSAKTYTITVTGTSGSNTHSTTVTLTVQ